MIKLLRHCALALGSLALASSLAQAAGLSADERRLTGYIDEHQGEILTLLEQAVRLDSATENLDGVRRVGAFYRGELEPLGFSARWVAMPPEIKRAGHLFAEHTGTRGKRLLLIGHLDTVLPGGGAFRRDGDKAYGAGAGDMKGGDTVRLVALKALASIGALDGTQITVALTGDEESAGHPIEISRRELIEAAKRSDLALGFENAVRDTATVARRGSSNWTLNVTGIQAHSAGIFSAAVGDGAIYEAARILNTFHEELRKEGDGLTFNPSVIVGGTDVAMTGSSGTASGKGNVIAREAIVKGDLRFASAEQLARVRAKMTEIVAKSLRRTSAKITFEDSYPAMEAKPANLALLARLDEVSRDLGFGKVEACDPNARGAGDVSFVAPYIPTIDGLGARGGGAHTPNDYADTKSLPELAKRTAILIYRLTR
jgi:glutamate carboxypeptidase